ncbi:hypothetical protein [Deinococcus budaensis]|uniref:Uncharacterized protein n=1 Tax=Deinococcus budaensis TaxID=1665626 RepID=A0A7W8LRF1_9DEIO|nr:hypothetical protein [Deinococcus budaensis]MBB5235567.1 hypothetical protein [Deinococcus budaensis]
MPLQQQFQPQLTVTRESPEVVRLDLAPAVTPLRPGRLNLAVIAAHDRLAPLQEAAPHSPHGVALISTSGQLHRDLTGQMEEHVRRPVDLVRAVSLASTLLADAAQRGAARILLMWDHAPPSRLELELLVSSLARQNIALDVITTAAAESTWATLTSCAFGRVSVGRAHPVESFGAYLADRHGVVLEGAEVKAYGLVGIGPQWRAGQTTLPPLREGEVHRLHLRRSPRAPAPPRIEVRFLGLGYSVMVPVRGTRAARVA